MNKGMQERINNFLFSLCFTKWLQFSFSCYVVEAGAQADMNKFISIKSALNDLLFICLGHAVRQHCKNSLYRQSILEKGL